MVHKKDDRWYLMSQTGQIGFLIAVPLVLCAIAGRYADRLLGTSPLFFLIGILAAIVASSLIIYRKISALLKESEER